MPVDTTAVIQALREKIAGLEARNLCLEVRPEFRYVAQDKPETWPPLDAGRIVCWSVDDPGDIFISDGGFVGPSTIIAWMPVPIVLRT